MKETELREHARCTLCNSKVLSHGKPLFWRVTLERFEVDLGALSRQDGLTQLLGGNARLAQVMGKDEDMAAPMMPPLKLTVCERCAYHADLPVGAMAVIASRNDHG